MQGGERSWTGSSVPGMAPTITDRPDMAGYGVEDDLDGVLPWTWAVERLVDHGRIGS